MLPDWPKVKSEVRALFMEEFKNREAEWAPLSSMVPNQLYHEGVSGVLVREDGETDPMEMRKMSSVVTFETFELGSISLQEAFERQLEGVKELGEQKELALIETVSEAVEKVGNVIKSTGKPVGPDDILKTIEMRQIDFDEEGKPILGTVVMGPSASGAFEKAFRQLDEEPHRSKMNELISRKRIEWLDRESSRKLVD